MAVVGDTGMALGVRATRFSLRHLGFRRTVSLLDRLPSPASGRAPKAQAASAWAERIERVGGRPYGATCLDRSVFLWFLMRQRGLDGQLRIGVALDDGRLDGHAWVEMNGAVVNDDPQVAEHFEVFDEDPTGVVFR